MEDDLSLVCLVDNSPICYTINEGACLLLHALTVLGLHICIDYSCLHSEWNTYRRMDP